MVVILGILLGGFCGGVLRYSLAQVMRAPAGTFVANILGATLIGMATGFFRAADTGEFLTALIITGLAGGLSTWSTLAKELGLMIERRQLRTAALYTFFTVAIGLIAARQGLVWVTQACG